MKNNFILKKEKMLPIYDTLIKKLPKTPLDMQSRKNFLASISKCSQEEMEILFGIILSFCSSEKIPLSFYPFNSHPVNDGIQFQIDDIPIKLQNILNKFISKISSLNKEDVNWSN